MISLTINTFLFPGWRYCSILMFPTTRLSSSNSLRALRISSVMWSNALWAANGPGRSMLAPALIVTWPLMKISPLSGAPGRPHIMLRSNSPSEEPNSPIWTPLASVPVRTITTPLSSRVIPCPISPSSLTAIGWTSMIVSL